jgi:hypothetical protein
MVRLCLFQAEIILGERKMLPHSHRFQQEVKAGPFLKSMRPSLDYFGELSTLLWHMSAFIN